ncbi:MAG TPA: hypothetical protein VHL52_11255 [Acidimicrobiia bacterium]|nr:hypothetical protein [Acidimicrobiia bacterium]
MITRNRRQDPLATLEDVRKASLGVPLVVVDNGSMDHSAAAVRHRYRDVLVISLDHNAGAVARHIAVDKVDTLRRLL